jgi:hypothetical protein
VELWDENSCLQVKLVSLPSCRVAFDVFWSWGLTEKREKVEAETEENEALNAVQDKGVPNALEKRRRWRIR